jgi:hypothetical protein
VCTIIRSKFVHKIFDVEVHCRLCDIQFVGNLFVAVAIANELQDLQFSGCKIILPKVFSKAGRHFRRNVPTTGMNRADYVQQFIFGHAFEDVSGGTSSHGSLNIAIAIRIRQHDDP